MSDKGKSDEQIENEEGMRVAMENTRGTIQAVRSQQYQRRLERRREVTRAYHADRENDERLAARAGHSAQRRERDSENRSGAMIAAHRADEDLDFFLCNRRSDEYNQRVRAGAELRIRQRDALELAKRGPVDVPSRTEKKE